MLRARLVRKERFFPLCRLVGSRQRVHTHTPEHKHRANDLNFASQWRRNALILLHASLARLNKHTHARIHRCRYARIVRTSCLTRARKLQVKQARACHRLCVRARDV